MRVLLLALLFIAPLLSMGEPKGDPIRCEPPTLIESLPIGIRWPPLGHNISESVSTYNAWIKLIRNTQYTLDIAAMYISLTLGMEWPVEAGGDLGYTIFQEIVKAYDRGVKIRVIVNIPNNPEFVPDLEKLKKLSGVEIREVDWNKITKNGGGILHTKMMIADRKVVYFGSANFDWRSLAQVKELGMILSDCPPLSNDMQKIYEIYWLCAENSTCPDVFPPELDTLYNETHPLHVQFLNNKAAAFVASGPEELTSPSRTSDTNAIIDIINSAKKFIHASVMEYSPISLYNKPPIYWTLLDGALRAAALRGVNVSILASYWNYTDKTTIPYLQSLDVLPNISVRLMWLPENKWKIPYTRVNHCKYLVTENTYYITTSNWTPDYFLQTGGISLTIQSVNRRGIDWPRINAIFSQDWSNASNFTYPLNQLFPSKYRS